jgi:IMP dehydrogenase/GMP reductase
MNKKLHYKDIVLANPTYSSIRSRDDISSDVTFLGDIYESVAIPANMECAISFGKAEELSEAGFFYILHRFYDYDDIYNWIENNQELRTISISVGVKDVDKRFIDKISDLRVTHITIDIAFGHSVLMCEMIKYIRDTLPEVSIIAGNVCTPQAVDDLYEWGADCVKVGLSCGASCTTYNTTGVGSPMFSTVVDCTINATVPIIADGGVRETADYCKALVAGATLVMAGSKFVECIDSPAPTINGSKSYYGSASARNKGHNNYEEGSNGVDLTVNNLTYLQYLDRVNQGIRSCMSYHDVSSLDGLGLSCVEWSVHTPR